METDRIKEIARRNLREAVMASAARIDSRLRNESFEKQIAVLVEHQIVTRVEADAVIRLDADPVYAESDPLRRELLTRTAPLVVARKDGQ